MPWHGKLKDTDIHRIARWVVADATARNAITTNPDGSSITDDDGLYCLCFQIDDGSLWTVTDTSPLTFTQTGGTSTVPDADEISVDDSDDYYNGTNVETILAEIGKRFDIEGEPTGFPNLTDSTFSFTDATRTLSISPVASSFSYWYQGKEFNKTAASTVVIADTEGLHLIYFLDATLIATHVAGADISDIIKNKALVSIIYWDKSEAKAIYVGEERHGLSMPGAVHEYLHYEVGLFYDSGLGLADISADGDASSNTHAQFGVSSGVVKDEDLVIDIAAVASTVGLPIYNLIGSAGDLEKTIRAGYSVLNSSSATGRLYYNEWTGTVWQLTEVPEHDFVLYHVFASTEKNKPAIVFVGQNSYGTKAKARTGAKTEIHSLVTNETLLPELRPIATVIFQTDKDWTNTVKARIVTTDEGDDYIDWRDEVFSRKSLTTSDHNALTNLQGGQAGEYHHLTEAQHDGLTDGGETTLHSHASSGSSGNEDDTEFQLFQNQTELDADFTVPVSGLEKLYLMTTANTLTLPSTAVPEGSRVGIISTHADGAYVASDDLYTDTPLQFSQYEFMILIWVSGKWVKVFSSVIAEIATCATIGYIAGGYDTDVLQDTDEYAPDTWTNKTDMPTPGRQYLAASTISNKGYIYCGYGTASLQDTDEYNPDTWTSKTDAPTPARSRLAASTISDKGYIYCGYGSAALQDCDEYDPNTWTSKTNAPTPARQYLAASTILDKGYIYGGMSNLQDTDEYDPDTWVSKTDMPTPGRAFLAATTINDKGYIFCGDSGGAIQDCDEYDPDTWTSKTDTPTPARYAEASFGV